MKYRLKRFYGFGPVKRGRVKPSQGQGVERFRILFDEKTESVAAESSVGTEGETR
jgi:hypothetical protein